MRLPKLIILLFIFSYCINFAEPDTLFTTTFNRISLFDETPLIYYPVSGVDFNLEIKLDGQPAENIEVFQIKKYISHTNNGIIRNLVNKSYECGIPIACNASLVFNNPGIYRVNVKARISRNGLDVNELHQSKKPFIGNEEVIVKVVNPSLILPYNNFIKQYIVGTRDSINLLMQGLEDETRYSWVITNFEEGGTKSDTNFSSYVELYKYLGENYIGENKIELFYKGQIFSYYNSIADSILESIWTYEVLVPKTFELKNNLWSVEEDEAKKIKLSNTSTSELLKFDFRYVYKDANGNNQYLTANPRNFEIETWLDGKYYDSYFQYINKEYKSDEDGGFYEIALSIDENKLSSIESNTKIKLVINFSTKFSKNNETLTKEIYLISD